MRFLPVGTFIVGSCFIMATIPVDHLVRAHLKEVFPAMTYDRLLE